MSSLLGAQVGEYRLEKFLGAGGMGEVYRAVHTQLGRVVAIKVLSQMEPRHMERFANEARIQASLQHPAIAAYYGLHEFRGRPCLIMELVDGETLYDRLRRAGPMAPGEACALLRQVASAVGYVHSRGVVHRDLKSNNIKITPGGTAKLLDFGIARAANTRRLTSAGMLVGTIENVAPEQIEGAEADVRSDIWALGVLLYEMVTGRLPFEGASVPDLYARIRGGSYVPAAQRNPAVTPAVEKVIARCLRQRPEQRFQTAADLERSLAGDGAEIERAPELGAAAPRPQPVSGARVSRRGLLIAAGAVGVCGVLGAYLASRWNDSNPENGGPRPGAAVKTVTVEVQGGTAEVYQQGRRVGSTPFQVRAAMGELVELELRRKGFQDLPVRFDVTERSVYSYIMEPEKD